MRSWRFLLGCLVALLCSGCIGALIASGQVDTLRVSFSANPSLKTGNAVTYAGWGDPQTLLLVGDDYRAQTKYYHRAVPHLANEMLLVRLDPNKPWISMMSIPRELWVTIHPLDGTLPYTNRINSGYTHGINTLLSTIKQVTGLRVNHVIATTFTQFEHAVDEMGCAYSTVDHRYYHVNLPYGEQYQEIDLQPGYQDLCGHQAREFVSYRHTDTSQVRDARDQSFMLDVKKQYGPSLAGNVGKFEKIFGHAVQTDPGLHSTTGILNLLGTLISSSSLRVRQVHFQTLPCTGTCPAGDLTATPQQIQGSVHSFLYGGSSIPPKMTTAALAHSIHAHAGPAAPLLAPVTADELAQARAAAPTMPFPYEFPRVQDRGGSTTTSCLGSSSTPYLRSYMIKAPDGSRNPIYVAVFAAPTPTAPFGQCYDVQGTTWTDPPMLSGPDQTIQVGSRNYMLYYEADKLKMVAWREHGAVYWVRNTLTDGVQNNELLAIAEQTKPVLGVSIAGQSKVNLKTAFLPTRPATALKISSLQTAGSIAALVSILAVPVLLLLLLRRRGELRDLDGELEVGSQAEARLSAATTRATARFTRVEAGGAYSPMRVYASTAPRPASRPLTVVAALLLVALIALSVLISAHAVVF